MAETTGTQERQQELQHKQVQQPEGFPLNTSRLNSLNTSLRTRTEIKKILDEFANQAPYESPYAAQLQNAVNQYMDLKFEYDPEKTADGTSQFRKK